MVSQQKTQIPVIYLGGLIGGQKKNIQPSCVARGSLPKSMFIVGGGICNIQLSCVARGSLPKSMFIVGGGICNIQLSCAAGRALNQGFNGSGFSEFFLLEDKTSVLQ